MSDRRATYRVIEATEDRPARLSRGFHRLGIALAAIPAGLGSLALVLALFAHIRMGEAPGFTVGHNLSGVRTISPYSLPAGARWQDAEMPCEPDRVQRCAAVESYWRDRSSRDELMGWGVAGVILGAFLYGLSRALGWIANGFSRA